MANKETVSVHKADAYVVIGGNSIDIVEMTITASINSIPQAQILCPLSYADRGQEIQVYRSDDFSASVSRKTYDLAKNEKENRSEDVDIYFATKKIGNDDSLKSQDATFSVKGWMVTDVALQPQNRTSPGGVLITVSHPMCKLLDSPGFFYAPGADYEKVLKDKEIENILEAADSMLDVIYDTIAEDGYTQEKISEQNDYEDFVAGAKVRLQDYIKPGTCKGFPYVGCIGEADMDAFTKASAMIFALVFAELPQSVPLNALLSLCKSLGCYVAPRMDGSDKAELNILDPWNRKRVYKIDDDEVMSTQITEDTDRVCGVRLVASPKETVLVSNFADMKPFDKRRVVGGETMFFFDSVGKIINTTVPQFLLNIFARMQRILSKKNVSNYAASGKKRAPSDRFLDPKEAIKSLGQSATAALYILDKIQAATAKSIFLQLHRATQRASVTLPLVNDDIPKLGSFMSFTAGTGGDKITGMLTSVSIRMSASSGQNTLTYGFSYCGEVAKDPQSGEALSNPIWEEDEGDDEGGEGG